MNFLQSGLSVVGKLSVIIVLLGAFLFGLGGTLFMALRSPEVKVPEVVGKDYLAAEKELENAGLKLRKRTDRFSQEKPNTILEQSPLAGDSVKIGQTVSVVIARAEAESGEKAAEVKKENVNTAPSKVDEPSEVDKARQKRKAANKNANANKNVNANSNSNGNSSDNSGATNFNSSGGSNSNGNSNAANRTNSNAAPASRNANAGGSVNSNSRTPNANTRNANSNGRSNASGNRGVGTNQRNQ